MYLEEVSDVICIAQAELPSLLALNQLAEALLRVKHGSWLLCRLVANAPDSFEQGTVLLITGCCLLKSQGGLSQGIFELHTSSRSETFSLLICLDATKCLLLMLYTL